MFICFFSNYKCRMAGTPTPFCRQKNHLHLLSGKHRHHFLKQSYISSSSRRICAKDRRLCKCYVHRASDVDQRSLRVKTNALPPPWRYFSVCLTKLLCGNWQIPQLFCNFFCLFLWHSFDVELLQFQEIGYTFFALDRGFFIIIFVVWSFISIISWFACPSVCRSAVLICEWRSDGCWWKNTFKLCFLSLYTLYYTVIAVWSDNTIVTHNVSYGPTGYLTVIVGDFTSKIDSVCFAIAPWLG